MSVTDELLENAQRYRARFDTGDLAAAPARGVAVIACMDARLDIFGLLGLRAGDAHVIRNAGGVITPDAIRSLSISQYELGTREVVLIHHTTCGMQSITDDGFRGKIKAQTGFAPDWAVEAFADIEDDVRESIARITANPFIPHKDSVRGFVFDVKSGELREVTP